MLVSSRTQDTFDTSGLGEFALAVCRDAKPYLERCGTRHCAEISVCGRPAAVSTAKPDTLERAECGATMDAEADRAAVAWEHRLLPGRLCQEKSSHDFPLDGVSAADLDTCGRGQKGRDDV